MKNLMQLLLLLCLTGSTVVRADPQTVDDSKPVDTRSKESRPQQERKKTSQPVPIFTPSEKVGADSAVSFPVDI